MLLFRSTPTFSTAATTLILGITSWDGTTR
jgi:hypothetical protein